MDGWIDSGKRKLLFWGSMVFCRHLMGEGIMWHSCFFFINQFVCFTDHHPMFIPCWFFFMGGGGFLYEKMVWGNPLYLFYESFLIMGPVEVRM